MTQFQFDAILKIIELGAPALYQDLGGALFGACLYHLAGGHLRGLGHHCSCVLDFVGGGNERHTGRRRFRLDLVQYATKPRNVAQPSLC